METPGGSTTVQVLDGPFSVAVPLVDVIQRSRIVVVAVVACIVFAPTGASFARNLDDATWADITAMCLSMALLACIALAPCRRHYLTLAFAAAFVLLAAPLVPIPYGAQWIPILNIGVAVCGGAALAMRPIPAGIVVVASSALMAFSALRTPPSEPLARMPVLVPVTLALLCGIAFILFMQAVRHSAAALDKRASTLREAEAAEARRVAEAHERATVERSIHETVLNTLQALSMDVALVDESRTRETCARDLEVLAAQGSGLPAMRACDVIDIAAREFMPSDLSIAMDVDATEELDASIATALRDAIVEALRNVQRHSGSSTVAILARASGDVVSVQIRDEGVGLNVDSSPRFGVQRTIILGIRGVGGEASVESAEGEGTCVFIRVPAASQVDKAAARRSSTAPRAVSIAGESGWVRLGLILIPCALIPWSTWIGDAVDESFAVRALCGVFVATVAILSLAWDTIVRVPLALLAITTSGVLLVLVALSNPACSAEVPVQALIAAATGAGLFLPIVALPGTAVRLLCVGAMPAVSIVVVLALPEDCRAPARSALDAAIYLLAWSLAIAWIEGLFAAREREADTAWLRILADQQVVAEERARIAAWAAVDDETRDLLVSIATGNASIANSRERARRAAMRTRDRLLEGGTRRPTPTSVAEVIAELVEPPRLVVLGSGPGSGPMPLEWRKFLTTLIGTSSKGAEWTWRVTVDGHRERHVIVGQGSMAAEEIPALPKAGSLWRFSVVESETETSVLATSGFGE